MKKKILVVDDESSISDIIKFNLEKEGYEVETAADGGEALIKTSNFAPDLVILDVMLPVLDGFEVCRKLRQNYVMPIIMLTAKEDEVDKVLGLELGADDYITKPFGMKELTARVKANLRRVTITESETANQMIYSDDLVIDPLRYEVRRNDKLIELTFREFEMVRYLAAKANQMVTREQLLRDVWGYEYIGDERTVDVTVRRVREKLEDNPGEPRFIKTKRGVGYYFQKY